MQVESRTNLLVRFLDHAVNDETLERHFAPYGVVTSSIVQRDIHSGESRGFGFVRFQNPEEAVKALEGADGSKLLGKRINVLWAKKVHDDAPAGEARRKINKLFLRNIPISIKERDLGALFEPYGQITDVSIHKDTTPLSDPSLQRHIAFVTFAEEGAAEKALREVHNTCPFPQCQGIPLIGKLSEDYTQKKKTTQHHHVSPSSMMQQFQLHRRTQSVPDELQFRLPTVHSRTSSYNMEYAEYPLHNGAPAHSRTSSYSGIDHLEHPFRPTHSRSNTYSNPPVVRVHSGVVSYSIYAPARSTSHLGRSADSLSNSQSSTGSRYSHNPYSLEGPTIIYN